MKDADDRPGNERLLRRVDALAKLSDDAVSRIASQVGRRDIKRGELLIAQGDVAEELFIVATGRFWVISEDNVIAEIGPGEPIGELAFFAGGKRSADVKAARNGSVLVLSKSAFDSVAAETPALAMSVLASVSERLVRTVPDAPKLRPRVGQIIGVFPGAGQTLDPKFARTLATAFRSMPDWTVLTGADLPPEGQSKAAAIEGWIDSQDAEVHPVLIVEDTNASTPWTNAVASVADVSVIVLDGEQPDAAISDLERSLYDGVVPGSLHYAITRPHGATPPSKTGAVLAGRPDGLRHHIALDQVQDFERLSRFITGKALGLVLCGGGALGTAHLGAIKALQEAGIDFDFMGGTSVGAAMAGAISIGLSPDRVMDLCEDIFLRSRAMSRWTVPKHSVLDHRRLDEGLHKHYGDVEITDIPLNFFAIATNLTSNNIAVIRDGPLWKAIRASGSLPGLFPPFLTDDGEVLIDGGLLDNLPVSAMQDLKAGPNLILNFEPSKPWRVRARYEDLPGRLGAFLGMFRPRGLTELDTPSIFSTLSRSMAVNAQRLKEHTEIGSDVLINISTLPGMTFMDWDRGRDMFDSAYKQMSEALSDAQAKSPAATGADLLQQVRITLEDQSQTSTKA